MIIFFRDYKEFFKSKFRNDIAQFRDHGSEYLQSPEESEESTVPSAFSFPVMHKEPT